jgi:cytochrome P450
MLEQPWYQVFPVSLSAIVAASTLVFAVMSRWREARNARVLEWQRGVVHSIFQKEESQPLSFNRIIQLYRSEASAFSTHKLKPDELSADALRKILIGLVSSRVLDQRGGDNYALHIWSDPQFSETMPSEFLQMLEPVLAAAKADLQIKGKLAGVGNAFDDMAAELRKRAFGDMDAANEILSLVADEPYRFSPSDVVLRVARSKDISADTVKAQVIRMIARGEIQEYEGKLCIPSARSA